MRVPSTLLLWVLTVRHRVTRYLLQINSSEMALLSLVYNKIVAALRWITRIKDIFGWIFFHRQNWRVTLGFKWHGSGIQVFFIIIWSFSSFWQILRKLITLVKRRPNTHLVLKRLDSLKCYATVLKWSFDVFTLGLNLRSEPKLLYFRRGQDLMRNMIST